MFTLHNESTCCYYCRRPWTDKNVEHTSKKTRSVKSKDHIIAKSRVDPNCMMNLISACTVCNGAKRSMTLPEFARWLLNDKLNRHFRVPGVSNIDMANRAWKLFNKTSWLQKQYGISGHERNPVSR